MGPDADRRPRRVEGHLQSWWVDGFDYVQTVVDGVVVDPGSIVPIAEGSAPAELVPFGYRVSRSSDAWIVRAWSTHALPFEPSVSQVAFRDELRVSLSSMVGDPSAWLCGLYVSPDHRRADLENDLSYNVGVSSFRGARHSSLRFVRAVARPSAQEPRWRHYYRWRVGRQPDRSPWALGEVVASAAATLPAGPIRVEQIWAAVRSGVMEISGRPLSRDEPIRLAIQVGIDRDPVSIIKPLVDGALSGLQAHRHNASIDLAAGRLAERLKRDVSEIESMLSEGPSVIEGQHQLIWPRGDGVQWNPADDSIVWLDVESRSASPGELLVRLERVSIA